MNTVLGGPDGGYSLFSTFVTVFVTTAVVGGGTAVVTTHVAGRRLFLQMIAPMTAQKHIHTHTKQTITGITPAIIPTSEREECKIMGNRE